MTLYSLYYLGEETRNWVHKYQISLQNFNLILCLLYFLDVGFFQSHEPWDTRAHSLIRTASQTYDFRVSAGN